MLRAFVIVLLTLMMMRCDESPGRTSASVDKDLTVRNAHVMCYDDHRQEVVLFGGADEEQVLGDTWAWRDSAWIRVSRVGPLPRTFANMTDDPTRGVVFLFGGNRVLFGNGGDQQTFLNDTWFWNGRKWQQIPLGSPPPPRAEAAMALDEQRSRLVLFGGYRMRNGEMEKLGDTWEWYGSGWIHMSDEGPPPQNGAAMVFDAARGKMVLFGEDSEKKYSDTWEWDGVDWWHIAGAHSERRYNAAMVYDAGRQRIVRFGGWDGERRRGDTWTYDGRSWTRIAEDGPAPRNHAAMAYDAGSRRIVLFGGHDGSKIFGDTWTLSDASWRLMAERPPLARVDNGH